MTEKRPDNLADLINGRYRISEYSKDINKNG